MNEQSHRRPNRGDENNPNLKTAVKTKPQDKKFLHNDQSRVKVKRSASKIVRKVETAQANLEQKSSTKKHNTLQKDSDEPTKNGKVVNYGDNYTLKEVGKICKYVFHADDTVALKCLSYTLDVNESLLTLYDPKKPSNKRSYYILSAKEVFYNQVKEHEAFQLKVKKPSKDIISDLILKAKSTTEKSKWLEEFGLKIELVSDVLQACIKEVENRRFQKGQQKRNEVKELKDVDVGTLIRAMDALSCHKFKLSNEKRWNISRIEKLIQILLTEIPQPLIPFKLQENLAESSNVKTVERDYAKILKRLPPENRTILMMLMAHLENLTNYYIKQLNASSIESEKIRRNICSRLTPLIIRQELNKDGETLNSSARNAENGLVDKFCNFFYRLMETTASKKLA